MPYVYENSCIIINAFQLSTHAANNLALRLPIPRAVAQATHAAQVAHHVLGLAKVHLLQQVAHLELHVLDQLADIGNVAVVCLDGEILLHLARHVSGEIELAARRRRQREDDGRRQLVVRSAAALNGLKDVDRVPDALGRATRR